MGKTNNWWTSVKKYNFDEAIKALESYENDFKYKGYVEFQVYKPNDKELKMTKIVKIVIFLIVTLSFLFISTFIYKAFSESGFKFYIIIFFAFMAVAVILCLIFPDKTKYVETVRVSDNDIIIKLQDTREFKDKTYRYDFKSCTLDFKRHYHRKTEDSIPDEDGMNMIINGSKFLIKNTSKYIELNVFVIYVNALKNGKSAREEVAEFYKW